jgi:hypothetical protein
MKRDDHETPRKYDAGRIARPFLNLRDKISRSRERDDRETFDALRPP